ncbi:hypothetical protein COK_2140 [Mannheimia haemolytica serotype A2 str. BOVINE]|nr:hypothetical protein COK_2140 [Mannheimia haemolytica serotype A2 str. BOVINE]
MIIFGLGKIMKELAILMLNLFIHLGLIITPSYFVFSFFIKNYF